MKVFTNNSVDSIVGQLIKIKDDLNNLQGVLITKAEILDEEIVKLNNKKHDSLNEADRASNIANNINKLLGEG